MDQQTSASRESNASLNDAAFGRILREHPAIYIRTSEASLWRPTRRKKGSLRGLESFGELEILLTDGLVAWFMNSEGACIHGHVASFIWTEPEATSGFYYDKVTKKMKFFLAEKVGGSPGPLFSTAKSELTLQKDDGTGARHPNASGEHRKRNGRSTTFSLAMEMLK